MTRFGTLCALLALTVLGACGHGKSAAMDPALQADLQAATARNSQVFVSEIEGGLPAAPKPAVKVQQPKATPRAPQAVIPQPEPAQSEVQAPAPAPESQPQPQAAPEAPRPQPVNGQAKPAQDGKIYKTEGEIFRKYPFIRP